ncbi:hypothetical protein PR003_g28258 [Phytophthora rubi]|uniref:DUF6818 domain-containing protein n=1 Tax=Phytophthora rubi TaxID=129364 RepID=A0A6A4BV94_9STRA|nr:hypothetical protein PR003_g28258 [Phytophthora rubi]
MVQRGRRAGYHNYSLNELMLLCNVVDKFKPLGRNMWEDAALEYNSRRERGWLERDFDSLRRKFRNLYGKPKPTGIYSEIPPKLRHIALAHNIQYAIEVKSGAHTSHDGFDRGQDDAHLLRDVDAVLAANDRNGTNDDDAAEEGAADNEDP